MWWNRTEITFSTGTAQDWAAHLALLPGRMVTSYLMGWGQTQTLQTATATAAHLIAYSELLLPCLACLQPVLCCLSVETWQCWAVLPGNVYCISMKSSVCAKASLDSKTAWTMIVITSSQAHLHDLTQLFEEMGVFSLRNKTRIPHDAVTGRTSWYQVWK